MGCMAHRHDVVHMGRSLSKQPMGDTVFLHNIELNPVHDPSPCSLMGLALKGPYLDRDSLRATGLTGLTTSNQTLV